MHECRARFGVWTSKLERAMLRRNATGLPTRQECHARDRLPVLLSPSGNHQDLPIATTCEPIPMTLTQLRYFIAIADSGLNITTAAERVHATQPGVSKQLKQFEDELGFQLFSRKGKSLHA